MKTAINWPCRFGLRDSNDCSIEFGVVIFISLPYKNSKMDLKNIIFHKKQCFCLIDDDIGF